jgi:hypothetical protein
VGGPEPLPRGGPCLRAIVRGVGYRCRPAAAAGATGVADDSSGGQRGGRSGSGCAARTGVNAETLRYYERRGLLDAPPRTPAGYREYPSSAVGVLRFVKRAQQLPCPRRSSCGQRNPVAVELPGRYIRTAGTPSRMLP